MFLVGNVVVPLAKLSFLTTNDALHDRWQQEDSQYHHQECFVSSHYDHCQVPTLQSESNIVCVW